MPADIESRVRKSLVLFRNNAVKVDSAKLTDRERGVVELAKMYASDTESWIGKGDYVTAFSSIEYAHGLLDAIIKTRGLGE